MKALLPVLLLLSACAGPDAKTCVPEAVATLQVQLVGNVPVTVAGINGRPAALIVDTGSDTVLLNAEAAKRLALPVTSRPAVDVDTAGGQERTTRTVLPVLRLGNLEAKDVPALVGSRLAPPHDGVLGISVLSSFDLDLDAPNGVLTLYSPRTAGCAGAPPPWTGPFTRLAVEREESGHLFIPVTLNGLPFRALLDTGTSRTIVGLPAAAAAGLTKGELLRGRAGVTKSLDAADIIVRPRRFRQFGIGGDLFDDPVLDVAALPPEAGDLIIGSDYLGTRRMWIALATGTVFAGAPDRAPDPAADRVPDQPRPR